MSADMRPDYWKPWYVRYAEFEGRSVALIDPAPLPPEHKEHLSATGYQVVDLGYVMDCPRCGMKDGSFTSWAAIHAATDSLTEAEAAFEAACAALREEGA